MSIFFTLFIASSFNALSCFSFIFLSISSFPNKLPSLSSNTDKSAWSILISDLLLSSFISISSSSLFSFFSFLSLFSSSNSSKSSSTIFSSKLSVSFNEILILSEVNKFPPSSPYINLIIKFLFSSSIRKSRLSKGFSLFSLCASNFIINFLFLKSNILILFLVSVIKMHSSLINLA